MSDLVRSRGKKLNNVHIVHCNNIYLDSWELINKVFCIVINDVIIIIEYIWKLVMVMKYD